MYAVIKLSKDGVEFFRAAVFYHDSPRAISADHVKCLGLINISRVEVSVRFQTLLLQQTPCQQSHVPSGKSPCSRWLLRRFRRTLARILPEIESKENLR